MRVIVIGATGSIGREIVAPLEPRHEVVRVGRRGGEHQVDIVDPDSIRELYRRVGRADAVVCAAGGGAWRPLAELTDEDFAASLRNKLMGQVNVVRYGMDQLPDGGSFTLTSGILSHRPQTGSATVSVLNADVEAFGRAAALELPRLRVNVVSPGWVSETLAAMGLDPGTGTPAKVVARAYVASVEGRQTGDVIEAAGGA